MPYPSEHACRISEPSEFQQNSFRRISQGKLDIIIGKKKGANTTSTQAFRYPIKNWTESEAKKHCEKNNGRFEPAKK